MLPARIFLDLDDVCNRFTMYALKYVGCPVDVIDDSSFDPAFGYDLVARANALHPTCKFTKSTFWDSMTREVWASVPESAEFRLLLHDCIALVGIENICILSNPISDPDCLAGKLEWIHSHFPKRMHRQFLIGPPKYFCARPDALLIDDCDDNIEVFRAHGGQALLVPRPWNSLHECHTQKYLTEVFDMLFKWKKYHADYERQEK